MNGIRLSCGNKEKNDAGSFIIVTSLLIICKNHVRARNLFNIHHSVMLALSLRLIDETILFSDMRMLVNACPATFVGTVFAFIHRNGLLKLYDASRSRWQTK